MTKDTHTDFADYVTAHPDTTAILDRLRDEIAAIGPVCEVMSKSQVAFRRRRTIVIAWAPGQYLQGAAAPLVLTFAFRAQDCSPRWKEVTEPRPGYFTHHLELHDPDDIDDEVRAWLHAAWDAAP